MILEGESPARNSTTIINCAFMHTCVHTCMSSWKVVQGHLACRGLIIILRVYVHAMELNRIGPQYYHILPLSLNDRTKIFNNLTRIRRKMTGSCYDSTCVYTEQRAS